MYIIYYYLLIKEKDEIYAVYRDKGGQKQSVIKFYKTTVDEYALVDLKLYTISHKFNHTTVSKKATAVA